MNRPLAPPCLLLALTFTIPALVSCGGAAGVSGGPGTTPGNNAADFVASFEGFDSSNRRLSLTMTPTEASRGQVTGTFNDTTSRMTVYDPSASTPSRDIAVSGTFNGQTFSITLASASSPLATAYTGTFVDPHTVEIRSGSGAALTLRRNGYFFPDLQGNWTGTVGGEPWVLQFGFLEGYDASDSSSRVIGTELRGGRTSNVTGFLNVRHVRLTIERAGGPVTIEGTFPMSGGTVSPDTLDFGAQGRLTRGGAPDSARVLYRLDFAGVISSVDLFGNQSSVVAGSATSPRIYDVLPSPDKTHLAYWRQEAVGEDLWIVRLSDGAARRITVQGDSGFTQWAAAQWSPTGSHLAYSMRPNSSTPFNTWVVDADGTTPVPLTNNVAAATPLAEVMLSWAPVTSGAPQLAMVATESATADRTHLYLQRMDGSARVQLTPTLDATQHVRSMSWSPDGLRLAFVGNVRTAASWELFVATSAGVVVQILPQLGSSREVTAYRWSPDSQRLAFVSNAAGANRHDLNVVSRDSTASQVVSDFANGPFTNQSLFDFSWSPDSSRLAAGVSHDNSASQMYVMTADGSGNPMRVTDNASLGLNGTMIGQWSPDSARVAYTVQSDSQSQSLFSASTDGTSRIPLATGVSLACSLDFAWSPNGSRMAYVRDLPSGDCALHAVDADGTDAHALEASAHGGANVNGFTWWPDSLRIVYLSNRDDDVFFGNALFVAYANGNASLKLSSPPGVSESVALYRVF